MEIRAATEPKLLMWTRSVFHLELLNLKWSNVDVTLNAPLIRIQLLQEEQEFKRVVTQTGVISGGVTADLWRIQRRCRTLEVNR